jgi:soluble lytic murein transglycosylase-like protein
MTALTRAQIIDLVKLKCQDTGLDPALVCAIVAQESGFNQYALRFEPLFLQRYVVPLKLTNPTEAELRAFSFGLLQIMGQSARELDYNGHMGALLEPDINLFWGMRHFRNKLSAAGYVVEKALLLWNGGGIPQYPDQVLARIGEFTDPAADPRDARSG